MTAAQIRAAIGLFALACVGSVHAGSGDPAAEQELRRISQEMVDAIAPGHVDVWRKYLHERLIHVDENGVVRGKEELLNELTPLPPGLAGSITVDRFKTEVHGNVAVSAYETQEHLDYHGQALASRFRVSDTWLKTNEGWRLLSEQIAAVLKDPPAMKPSAEALCAYNGLYALTKEITATVHCTAEGLTVERTGRPPVNYLAEVPDVFFVPGQPRTRRIFERDARGEISAFVDRREGEDVRWTKHR